MKIRTRLTAVACAVVLASAALVAQQLNYPATRKIDHVDTYSGVKVADPYRWLEDDNTAETAKWVEEENKVTSAYFEQIPYRQRMRERLEKLYNYPKIGAPSRKTKKKIRGSRTMSSTASISATTR